MSDPLGLSIGTANLVAVRAGEPPLTRRAVLRLFPRCAPEVGATAENPFLTEAGAVIGGFVLSFAEATPVVAPDGSRHDPGQLLAQAVDAMVALTGADATAADLVIAVPAHWGSPAWLALQNALENHAGLATLGGPAQLVSDATAALTALGADGGMPDRGVVALLDFGAGGTSISLADAESGFAAIAQTRRYRELSGDGIDEALLAHVLHSVDYAGDTTRIKADCRAAKERLSVQSATEVIVELPESRYCIQLSRTELERMIEQRLSGALGALEELLERNAIRWSQLAAVATVGGGASMPLIGRRLSARRRVPVVASQRPAFDMAAGAELVAARGTVREPAVPAEVAAGSSTATMAAPPLRDGGAGGGGAITLARSELAWSQEDGGAVPYGGGGTDDFDDDIPPPPPPPQRVPPREPHRRRRRLPTFSLWLGAVVVVAALGGVAYTLTAGSGDDGTPTVTNIRVPSPELSSLPSMPAPTATSVAPSTSAPAPPPAASTTTTTAAPTTTTQAPTTTTTQPTTTTPATTTTTPPTTTTTPPTTATTPTTTTTTVPMTTDYMTIPFVPVPIPIQVPQNGG